MAAPARLRIAARSANWYNKNRDMFMSGIEGDITQFNKFLDVFYKESLPSGKRINRSGKTTAKKIMMPNDNQRRYCHCRFYWRRTWCTKKQH